MAAHMLMYGGGIPVAEGCIHIPRTVEDFGWKYNIASSEEWEARPEEGKEHEDCAALPAQVSDVGLLVFQYYDCLYVPFLRP